MGKIKAELEIIKILKKKEEILYHAKMEEIIYLKFLKVLSKL